MNAGPGDKVVCIKGFNPWSATAQKMGNPQVGDVYTVVQVVRHYLFPSILGYELDSLLGAAFNTEHFKKVDGFEEPKRVVREVSRPRERELEPA